MRNILKLTILTSLFLVSGCVSLSSVSLTPIPGKRKNQISAESYRFIFLALNFDNNYVDEAAAKLRSQCEGGKVTGILTKDESIVYFPLFAHARRIKATGYCQKK